MVSTGWDSISLCFPPTLTSNQLVFIGVFTLVDNNLLILIKYLTMRTQILVVLLISMLAFTGMSDTLTVTCSQESSCSSGYGYKIELNGQS